MGSTTRTTTTDLAVGSGRGALIVGESTRDAAAEIQAVLLRADWQADPTPTAHPSSDAKTGIVSALRRWIGRDTEPDLVEIPLARPCELVD